MYTMRIISLTLFVLALIMSCKNSSTPVNTNTGSGGEDMTGLKTESIAGSSISYARQYDANGLLQIEGFIENGKKTGMWIKYTPEGEIELINNYVNGLLEGAAMHMTFRNQVDLLSNYKQGFLEGKWTQYRFGKPIETRDYKAGKLDGVVRIFEQRDFTLKQEMYYKEDKLDGPFRYYNSSGQVTLEYTYKNGEKIEGGMTGVK